MSNPQQAPPIVNGPAATPSLRTLGTGSTEAAAGNDVRLRTPTNAQLVPAASKIPLADGTGKIDSGWIYDASGVISGKVTTGVQSFGGNKTFVGTVALSGGLASGSVDLGTVTPSHAGATARTLRAERSDDIFIKDMGAAGDGIIDDVTAINAAIAVASGKWIHFTAGTYRLASTVTFPLDVGIKFDIGAVLVPEVSVVVNGRIEAPSSQIFSIMYSGWAPTTAYLLGDYILSGTHLYRCTTGGTSGSQMLYRVSHVVGAVGIVDGGARWTCVSKLITFGGRNCSVVYPEWFGALGDSNGTSGNGNDDLLPIQAMFSAIDTTLGGRIYFESGKTYRVSDSMACYANNLHITGSAILFFDGIVQNAGVTHVFLTNWSNGLRGTIDNNSPVYTCGLYLGADITTVFDPVPVDPDDIHSCIAAGTSGQNITVEDITLKSLGSCTNVVWNNLPMYNYMDYVGKVGADFINNDVLTGSVSGVHVGTVISDSGALPLVTGTLRLTHIREFVTGETITGSLSGASAVVDSDVYYPTNIQLNHSAMSVWCSDNVTLRNVKFLNWNTDVVEIWGCYQVLVDGCKANNCGFNGFGGFFSDTLIVNNVFDAVAQPVEGVGLRTVIANNVFTNVVMRGLLVSTQHDRLNIDGLVLTNNTIVRNSSIATGSQGITCTSGGTDTDCERLKSVIITNNTIKGSYGSGMYIWTPEESGTVLIDGNNLTMTSALATGLTALELHTPLGSNAGRITIKNNTLCFPLATYNLAIDIATGNQPQVDIIGNHFIAPAGWYHAPSGFALENAIWFYEPDTQIGRCNIGENYINGKRFSLNLVDNDTSIVSTLYTYGRPLIKCTPAAPRDITEIDGNLGSIVTIVAGNGDVTIKNGTYLQTHTGADVNLVTGEKYQLVIYDYADNPPGVATHYYAKALIPIARYAAAAPVAGIYNLGDIVYNSSPAPGGSVGWICTTAGGPGVMVWKEFGLISL